MARARKPKKEPIEAATRLVVEAWPEPKKVDWQVRYGSKVHIGQYGTGDYYIKVEKCSRWRYKQYDYNARKYSDDVSISEGVIRSTIFKVGDDEVDAILDGLITLKELIKNHRTVKSTITEVKP